MFDWGVLLTCNVLLVLLWVGIGVSGVLWLLRDGLPPAWFARGFAACIGVACSLYALSELAVSESLRHALAFSGQMIVTAGFLLGFWVRRRLKH